MNTSQRLVSVGTAVALAGLLTACGSSADAPEAGQSVGVTLTKPDDEGASASVSSPAPDDASTPDGAATEGSGGAESSQASSAGSTKTVRSAVTSSAPQGQGNGATQSALAAIDAAEAKAGGQAYEIDDEDDDGSFEVEVAKGATSVEVKVSKDGTATVTERDDLDGDERQGLRNAKVTLSEAITTATEHAGGTLDDAELDEEDGTWFWVVSVDKNGDDIDVYVTTSSGTVSHTDD